MKLIVIRMMFSLNIQHKNYFKFPINVNIRKSKEIKINPKLFLPPYTHFCLLLTTKLIIKMLLQIISFLEIWYAEYAVQEYLISKAYKNASRLPFEKLSSKVTSKFFSLEELVWIFLSHKDKYKNNIIAGGYKYFRKLILLSQLRVLIIH